MWISFQIPQWYNFYFNSNIFVSENFDEKIILQSILRIEFKSKRSKNKFVFLKKNTKIFKFYFFKIFFQQILQKIGKMGLNSQNSKIVF